MKASCFLQRFFRLRRVAFSSRLQRNYISQKSLKSLRFCGKWSNSFRRPWYCLQMQTETAWGLKSSFVSAMLIERRPLLTRYQKLVMNSSNILKAKYTFELWRWRANLPEKWIHFKVVAYLNNLHANTRHFATKHYQMTLFCRNWSDVTEHD